MKKYAFLLLICLIAKPLRAETDPVHAARDASRRSESDQDDKKRLEIARQLEELTKRIHEGTPQFSMTGALQIGPNSTFVVNGESFRIDSETQVFGQMKAGAMVEVRGYYKPGETKRAFQVVVMDSSNLVKTNKATAVPMSAGRMAR